MGKIVLMISEEELTEKMQKIVADVFVKAKEAIEQQNADMLLTTQKVSEMLDVDKSTLWRWAKAGYLIPIKIGTKTRYRRSDVQKLLSGRG
ncbi:MAG: helix-turn-helix domain-containing protein [Bacteroidales bacterium]|jgi:excisionase family DNA binding protein